MEVRLRPSSTLTPFSGRFEPIAAGIDKISLMKSERLQGRLTYTEIA